MQGSRYEFYYDGILMEEPQGWDGWNGILRRDSGKGGIISIEEGTLISSGDTYQYFYTKRKEGYCSFITVLIKESCPRTGDFIKGFEGLIFLSDAVFNVTKCSVEYNLVDNAYAAKIENNRGIEVHVNAGKTKNGVDIPAIQMWTIAMFSPCDGTNWPEDIKAYRAYDVAAYLINFMTDGTVGFSSTALDLGGEYEGVFLTKGLLLRDVNNPDVSLKFKWEDFLRIIRRMCDLSFKIDLSGAIPVFVLEKTDDLFTDSTVLSLDNVYEITRQIDTAKNYAYVDLGTDDVIESTGCGNVLGDLAFPDQIDLIGCKKEQFAVTGTCNLDTSLDLTIDWVISSNVIENILLYSDTGYDDSVIVIDCDGLNDAFPNTAGAIEGDVFGTTPPVYYNTRFYNYQVATRHLRAIPSTLVKYLNRPDTGFRAEFNGLETITLPATVVSGATVRMFPWPFGDDFTAPNFDTNNDYGNGTTPGATVSQINSRFDAPFQDVYKFEVGMSLQVPTHQTIRVTYRRFDSSSVAIADYDATIKNYVAGTYPGEVFQSPLIFLNAGDIVGVQIEWEGTAGGPLDPVYFKLIATGQQGGTYSIYNPEEYNADLVKCKSPMTMAQFYDLKQNPTYKISLSDGENTITGWLETIKHQRQLGIADITLTTTNG